MSLWDYFKIRRDEQGRGKPTEEVRNQDHSTDTALDGARTYDRTSERASGKARTHGRTREGALDEARKRILRCRQEQGVSIDLKGLGLYELPSEIAELQRLTNLDASQNKIGPEGLQLITTLTNLKKLNLAENRLGSKGLSSLSTLKSLRELDIGNNGITSDGGVLEELTALRILKLAGNRLQAEGLQTIGRLTALRELDLSSNAFGAEGVQTISNLSSLEFSEFGAKSSWRGRCRNSVRPYGAHFIDFADSLIGSRGVSYFRRLRNLVFLDLSGNGIGNEETKVLADLFRLQSLDLSANGLEDISVLRPLENLRSLWLSDNREITVAPDFWNKPSLERVFAFQVSLGTIPPELLSKTRTDNCLPRLRSYFHDTKTTHPETEAELRDVKVMILGNGRVGKTQLRRRLSGLPFDERIPSTHGVEIVGASLSHSDGSQASTPLKIWDFGGQEIYLGTHALFLKTRAVFPILWTPELEANEVQEVGGQLFRNYPLDEWVRYVQALAGERSPVLLIQTQCESADSVQAPPMDVALREAFAVTPRVLQYSARTREGEGNSTHCTAGCGRMASKRARCSAYSRLLEPSQGHH